MTRKDFINVLLQESGVIVAEEDGHAVCTCCGGEGSGYEGSVKHAKNCAFRNAVSSLTDTMPEGELLPGVENRITIGMMLPYYAQLSQEEAATAEKLSLQLTADTPIADRRKAVKAALAWSPLADRQRLQTLSDHGIDSRSERLTFRNYLVFERALMMQFLEQHEQLTKLQREQRSMEKTFTELFNKKYGAAKQPAARKKKQR